MSSLLNTEMPTGYGKKFGRCIQRQAGSASCNKKELSLKSLSQIQSVTMDHSILSAL